MLTRVLIANRGEIARRIARTCRHLGISTVAVYSDADADAPHVRDADQAVRLGPAPAPASYLDMDRLLDAAGRTGCDAVHPGYGFLAEDADFARAVEDAGLTFVGPPADVIALMGDKAAAKRQLAAAGVPVIPGEDRDDLDDTALVAAAAPVGFPLMVKAVAGGGGTGMRVVRTAYERQGHPFHATARLWDDGIIEPAATRDVVGLGLAVATGAPIGPVRRGVLRM